jgi:hypothetical protein
MFEINLDEINLEWPVASRYVLRRVEGATKSNLAIYPADDATFTLHRPLEQNPSLYAEFAALDGTKESCLKFAHKYGLLFVAKPPKRIYDSNPLEGLTQWRESIRTIRDTINRCEIGRSRPAEALRQFGNKDKLLLGGLDAYLSMKSPKSPPSLDVRCRFLLAAIQLQAVLSILGGRKSVQCIECSQWFSIGAGARRSQSKFCSTRCKDSYHNRLKAEAKRNHHA